MSKKKQFILALLLAAALLLCACAAKEPAEPPTEPTGTSDDTAAAESSEIPSIETTAPEPTDDTEAPVEPITVPLTSDGIPLLLDDYVDICLEKYNITRAELQYTVTDLSTGEVTTLDNTERLLRGFQCFGLPLSDASGSFEDASYTLRIAAPDGSWYMEYHDGSHADYVYLSDYDLYVPLVYRVDTTAEGISEAIRRYADNGTLLASSTYTGIPAGNLPSFSVTDTVNDSFTGDGYRYFRTLPHIKISGADMDTVNQEILRRFSQENMKRDFCTEVSYRWTVKGDVLSVLIVGSGPNYGGLDGRGYSVYKLYNISLEQGRILTNDEVYAASGLSNIQTRVLHAIVSYGAEVKAATMPDVFFHDNPKNPNTLYTMVTELSELNYLDATPYFNEDGKLCIIGYIRTNLGTGGFYDSICVEDYDSDELLSARSYYEIFS